ncbi:hypothetical protein [Neomegalonema sp.]|nr:hypothetical protein [Neomegalonema sp.]MDD2868189.1 hypothetical protein [Neomegalonema sp.]
MRLKFLEIALIALELAFTFGGFILSSLWFIISIPFMIIGWLFGLIF